MIRKNTPLNILYINHYAGSVDMGMEFRPYYLAREWVRMGHNVRIVAGDYSHLRIKNPRVHEDFDEELIDGINYTWVKTGKYDKNGITRAMTMFRFVRKLLSKANWIADNWNPDVIITSSTYPMDTYVGQRIKKRTKRNGVRSGAGAILIHEVHDMWPSTLYEVGGLSKNNPFVAIMQLAENSAYSSCDKCVSLLPFAEDYMCEHGLGKDKFINVQNGIVEEDWKCYDAIPDEHKQFFDDKKEKFIVGYFGGHARSNALDRALDVAAEFQNNGKEDIAFVFVGSGAEKDRLVKRANCEGINNAFFLPPVNKKAIPDLLKHFDCSYMTGEDSPLYRFGLCLNKMYDSMMAGLPIICAFNAPDTLVRESQCGIQCDPKKNEEVVEAITAIKAMTETERKEMGERGKNRILQDFTYSKLAEKFANCF